MNHSNIGHRNRGVILIAVFIATFMTSVEVTIVTTALPSIISELHGLAYQSWIMSAYLLTTAITTPIYGKLADTLGRRKSISVGCDRLHHRLAFKRIVTFDFILDRRPGNSGNWGGCGHATDVYDHRRYFFV